MSVPDRMKEFEALVDRTHKAGLKVIIDFVPNHVARQYHSDAAPAGVKDFSADDDTTSFSAQQQLLLHPATEIRPVNRLGRRKSAYVEFPAKASGNDCFNAFPGTI